MCTTQEATAYYVAIKAECSAIEIYLKKQRKWLAREKTILQAWLETEKVALLTRTHTIRDFTTDYVTKQRDKLQAQVNLLKKELSLQQDRYDGLKRRLEMNNTLIEGYNKQIAEIERLVKATSARQVREKASMNKEQKVGLKIDSACNKVEEMDTRP